MHGGKYKNLKLFVKLTFLWDLRQSSLHSWDPLRQLLTSSYLCTKHILYIHVLCPKAIISRLYLSSPKRIDWKQALSSWAAVVYNIVCKHTLTVWCSWCCCLYICRKGVRNLETTDSFSILSLLIHGMVYLLGFLWFLLLAFSNLSVILCFYSLHVFSSFMVVVLKFYVPTYFLVVLLITKEYRSLQP
jgi:hypothetical protein